MKPYTWPTEKHPPGESQTIKIDSTKNTGDKIIRPNKLHTKSNALFILFSYHMLAPSTGMFVACINDDFSLAMNKTVFAISSGVPNLFAA